MVFLKKFEACKKRDREATERKLLRASSSLFAEKGYENTRTLEIAKAAGVNEALIARYFGGKEGLLVAALKDEESIQTVMKSKHACPANGIETLSEAKDFEQALLQFFKLSEDQISQKEQSMRIATSRAFVDTEVAEMVKSRIIEQRNPMIQTAFSEFTKTKKISKDELEGLTMLISASDFILNFMTRRVYQIDSKQIDQAVKVLAEALDLYLKSQPDKDR